MSESDQPEFSVPETDTLGNVVVALPMSNTLQQTLAYLGFSASSASMGNTQSFNRGDDRFSLDLIDQVLTLRAREPDNSSLSVLHESPAFQRRLQQVSRQELLVRACGAGKGRRPRIADLTAGFGHDALLLASFGCTVDLVERSPVMCALLFDGLQRAARARYSAPALERIRLYCGDGAQFLRSWTSTIDVIYLDPMFSGPDSTAQPKAQNRQTFRLLAALLEQSPRETVAQNPVDSSETRDDAPALLAQARKRAPRVVVKRRKAAKSLSEDSPELTFVGKSVRYDVYLNPQAKTSSRTL